MNRNLGAAQGQSGQLQKSSPTTRTESLDHPTHSQSLYRLSYPSPHNGTKIINIIIEVYAGFHVMILARHILAKQVEDANPVCRNKE